MGYIYPRGRYHCLKWSLLWTECLCPSPTSNSYVDTLILSDVYLRWGVWEVIRFIWGYEGGGLMMGLVAFWEETPESPLSTSLHYMRMQQEGGHLQVRKRVLVEIQPGWHPDPGLPKSPELWEINFCCINHLVYGILLWHPKLTITISYGKSMLCQC